MIRLMPKELRSVYASVSTRHHLRMVELGSIMLDRLDWANSLRFQGHALWNGYNHDHDAYDCARFEV